MGLLDDTALEASAVVANCAMNRERQLAGVNSYARELGFNPLDLVRNGGAWLDLCCGSGRALIQAAGQVQAAGRVTLTGVDLVDAFDPVPVGLPGLEFVCASATAWQPGRSFDLVTCVHGLHYIGDKLAVLTRAASWLTPDGRLIADLDLSSIEVGGPTAARRLATRLRAAGFTYSARRHKITCTGGRDVHLPYTYLGADNQVGPGYTGQPAVCSHYTELFRQQAEVAQALGRLHDGRLDRTRAPAEFLAGPVVVDNQLRQVAAGLLLREHAGGQHDSRRRTVGSGSLKASTASVWRWCCPGGMNAASMSLARAAGRRLTAADVSGSVPGQRPCRRCWLVCRDIARLRGGFRRPEVRRIVVGAALPGQEPW